MGVKRISEVQGRGKAGEECVEKIKTLTIIIKLKDRIF
jgi:hypothetical protein